MIKSIQFTLSYGGTEKSADRIAVRIDLVEARAFLRVHRLSLLTLKKHKPNMIAIIIYIYRVSVNRLL
jgi:hypothetical protein